MSKTYRFMTVDVFTDQPFSGNQLAVLPEAQGLTDAQMQAIAREFGYAETTFVLPAADPANDARVRIFTPAYEMPFAGHPNIGTAWVLHHLGRVGASMRFEEIAGVVPIVLRPDGFFLTAPEPLQRLTPLPVERAARSVGLEPKDVVGSGFAPLAASTGAAFAFFEIASADAFARMQPDLAVHRGFEGFHGVYAFRRAEPGSGFDIDARMFAPAAAVEEDAATGSAAVTLGALLAEASGRCGWTIRQGAQMGRPSMLFTEQELVNGQVTRCRVGGQTVKMFDGNFSL